MEDHGERLIRLETLLEEIRDQYLVGIKSQTEKTNGRVNELEKGYQRNATWIRFLWIALSAVAVAIGSLWASHLNVK